MNAEEAGDYWRCGYCKTEYLTEEAAEDCCADDNSEENG